MRSYRLTLFLILLAAVAAAIYSCNKYKDDTPPSSFGTLPEEKTVTASVQGRVLDENGSPVSGAAVTSGAASATTDGNGVFSFSNISMSSRFGFVKVVKQGYFTGSRSIVTSAGSSNYVTITLIPRVSRGSFNVSAGGAVAVQTGDTVSFDASSIVNAATNTAYTGTVHVYASYLDPLAADAAAHMPGDLRGIDTSGKETMLQSFGMMIVELEGDGGEKLQVAAGKQANISMKIPDALKATAPATIPLWYFNDTTGRWIEQGSGMRQGDLYVGKVTHFTWWNYDLPMGTVKLTLRLKDQHGEAMRYMQVSITSPTMGTAATFSDSAGYVSGLIPRGQMLSLKVYNSCQNVIGGANVGPALTDQDLGTLTVTDSRDSLVLSGKVLDCSNASVDSGYVDVTVDGFHYWGMVSKGAFSLTVLRCSTASTEVTLKAGNSKTQEYGDAVSLTADKGAVDAGTLIACGQVSDQYINATVDGKTYSVLSPPDSIYGELGVSSYQNTLNGSPKSAASDVYFDLLVSQNVTDVGTYSLVAFNLYTHNRFFMQYGVPMQFIVTQRGPVNGYILGTFSGTVIDTASKQNYPITGNFKTLRRM